MLFHAHAAPAAKAPLAPFSYEPSPLKPHDVELEVTHCGICHSDVHLVDGDWGMGTYPMVPGHEIVGLVRSLGDDVRHLRAGQRVGVGWQRGACLQCESCLAGDENLCREDVATCVHHHGGFADRVRLDSRFAFPLPEALSSEGAAPLLCGGVTMYAPLRRFARPSQRVGVVGIGGLGHLGLQFARAMGCEVTALSSSLEKEAEAREFGAHHFVATREPKALASIAGRLDVILSTVFTERDWAGLVKALRPNGVLCFLGVPQAPLAVSVGALLGGQKTITASAIGGRAALHEMLAFAARHGIEARTQARPMDEANAGLEVVRQGQARYRVVLTN